MKRLAILFLALLLVLPGLAQAKIFLEDTNDTLRVVTASGVTTIHMYASWADITTTALTPGSSTARVTTATTTVLVAAPAASTQRQIKGLSIRNNHASSSNAITVEFYDGTNATELIKYTLLAGETLQWGEDENFRVIDASGQMKALVAATQSGTWNITNISGTVSLPTGAATAANQDGIIKDGTGDTTQANVVSGRLQVENYNANLAADNSTLSTSKVPVLPGTVSTSAPTWTSGNQSALSLQTDGSVRSAVTNTVTVTASNLDVQIGGSDSLTIGTFPDNEPFNVAQVNGSTVQVASNSLNTTGGGLLASALVGQCDDTSPTALTENQFGHARINCTTHQQLVEVGTALPTGTNSIGQVTANAGTNLNTSALLTTSAHDAAFGTAGSADTQVRTVQGIASMTPLQVQSNSANLATEASVDGLEGGLGAAADAAATAGSTGSVTAKLRLMTSQLDTISTNISSLLTSSQLVDDDQTGASVHYRTSAGSTEDEHEVKSSAGRLFTITATNTNAAVRYLRCANQVIGSTTPGTTTVFLGLAIPGATTGAGFTTNFGPMGIAFSTGLTCWLVTGAADTDVAEVAANEIKVIYTYK